jgi:hypothetical protein
MLEELLGRSKDLIEIGHNIMELIHDRYILFTIYFLK